MFITLAISVVSLFIGLAWIESVQVIIRHINMRFDEMENKVYAWRCRCPEDSKSKGGI